MQFLKRSLSALLVAAMALMMLTACVPADSEPPASSKPGDSIGGTETPGGTEQPGETPDDPAEQKTTWLTSRTRAYFKERGATATDFLVDAGTISIEVNYGLKYHAKVLTWYLSNGVEYGFITNGSAYYYHKLNPQTGKRSIYTLNDKLAANMIAEASQYIYLAEMRLKVIDDTADRVVSFQSVENTDGSCQETVKLADGWTYIYSYNALGKLVAISSSSASGDAFQTYAIKNVTRSYLEILQ